jgi:two-component system, chemotaxis family, chemotaxis protein CheY
MPQGNKGLILLGEDDRDQRDILAELLCSEGYEVLTARAPEEVIEQLPNHPDIVLLDLLGISTPEVFQAMLQLHPRPGLVLLSANHRLPQLAAQLDADGHLLKPYELDELLEMVRAIMRAQRPIEPGFRLELSPW